MNCEYGIVGTEKQHVPTKAIEAIGCNQARVTVQPNPLLPFRVSLDQCKIQFASFFVRPFNPILLYLVLIMCSFTIRVHRCECYTKNPLDVLQGRQEK